MVSWVVIKVFWKGEMYKRTLFFKEARRYGVFWGILMMKGMGMLMRND